MGIVLRNSIRIFFHGLLLPMAKSIALMTIVMMVIGMLGASSFYDALKQLAVGENYSLGLIIGGIGGFIRASGAISAVPLESNFSHGVPDIDGNDYINPATGLPLINPGAGAHGGIDIHNNFYGSSSNEF